jgi:UDP-N-acetylglucosamine 4,6-dehydratase/5-epimerase
MAQIHLNPKLVKLLKNKVILVTGGSGSIGSQIVKKFLDYPVKSVRVLDINEHTLFQLKRELDDDSRIRLLFGNILDKERLSLALDDVDIIIHTAALKNIEITEFNPIETIDVNVIGTKNLIQIIKTNEKKNLKFLNLSTDKVADPSTLYGVTKQLSEKLVSWAGIRGNKNHFASVRLGNVFETRGNVFEVWDGQISKKQPLSITDPKMSRFFFHIEEAVEFILNCLLIMKNGEIFIPKMKSYKILDLANKKSKKHKIIGLRDGEKLDEILITSTEKELAEEKNDMWILRNNLRRSNG